MNNSSSKNTKKIELSYTPQKPKNVSFNPTKSEETLERIEKKRSLLDSDNDSSKIAFPKLLKKNSILSCFDISENILNQESDYISKYLRTNLRLPESKKPLDIKNHLQKLLGEKKKSVIIKTTINKEFSNNLLKNIKKKNFHSTITKGNSVFDSSNSTNFFLNEKNDSLRDEKKEKKKIYNKLIKKYYCCDISKDIIYKNGGYRKLFRQNKLSDSEESDDLIIDVDSTEKYIIKITNEYYVLFQSFIFILIFFFIIIYPLSFAFDYYLSKSFIIFIDIIFIIDFFIGFFIGYYDEEGKIVKNLSLCAYHYMTNKFVKNLIISFPYTSIYYNTNSLYKIIPIIRILKLYEFTYEEKDSEMFYDQLIINLHIIKSLSVHNPIYSFIEFFFGLLLLLHISTCIFILLGKLYYPNWTTQNLEDNSKSSKYITGFYYSLTTIITVGYGDITPVSEYERLYCIILMIIGGCLYSMVISILSSLFEDVQIREKNFNKNIYLLNDLRDKYRIPDILFHKVLRYLKYTSVINSKDNHLLMDSLPNYYKSILLCEIHGENLNHLNFFKGKSNEFKFTAVLFLKELNLIKGEYLIQNEDIVDEFYMVKKGILQIQKETNFEKMIKILKIREKEHFGEIYMISNLPMPFDVVGYSRYCELFYFKKSDFIYLYEDYPKEIEKILTLSWRNTIRIEMKAKVMFEKAESQVDIDNLTLYETYNENKDKKIKNLDNKLTVIHEENDTVYSLKNDIEDNEYYNCNKCKSSSILTRIKNDNDNNKTNDYSFISKENSINSKIQTLQGKRNSFFLANQKDPKTFGTSILSFKSEKIKSNNNRRGSNPIKFIHHKYIKLSPYRIKSKQSNNLRNSDLFHLPIINFTNDNNDNNNSEINKKNENIYHRTFSNKSHKINRDYSHKQINNYNLNFNVNIQNNFTHKNLGKNYKGKKTNKGNKGGNIDKMLQNLKGLSENLKNPTNFFKKNDKKVSILQRKNDRIYNLKYQIEKIDFIFEKILISIIERKGKNN